jgi:hypothetical protein
MRMHRLIGVWVAAAALAACETRTTDPIVAAVGGQPQTLSSPVLTLAPSQITMRVGSTAQLSTNAGSSEQGQLQWASSNTAVAMVSGSGLVTSFLAGTTTVTVRRLSDTTHTASAIIIVTAP